MSRSSETSGADRKNAARTPARSAAKKQPAAADPSAKPARKRSSAGAGSQRESQRPRAPAAEPASGSRRARSAADAAASPQEIPAEATSDWSRAVAAAEQRRKQSTNADNTELFKQLLRDKCLRAGMVGSLTSATALIPGLGKLAGLAIDGVGDLTYMVKLQRELALTTFAIYGREPSEKERERISRWILSFGAGGSELVEQVGKMIARQLAKNLAGRLIKRGLPFAEIAYSTVTHLAGTYLVGRRAQLYCIGLSDAEAEVLLESERGIKLQARRIKMLTTESLQMVEERFGSPGRTLADLFRRLTGTTRPGDAE